MQKQGKVFSQWNPVRNGGIFTNAGPLSKGAVQAWHFKALLPWQHAKAKESSQPVGPSSEWWLMRDPFGGMSGSDISSAPAVYLLSNYARGRTNSQSVNRVSVWTAYRETPAAKGEKANGPGTQHQRGGTQNCITTGKPCLRDPKLPKGRMLTSPGPNTKQGVPKTTSQLGNPVWGTQNCKRGEH